MFKERQKTCVVEVRGRERRAGEEKEKGRQKEVEGEIQQGKEARARGMEEQEGNRQTGQSDRMVRKQDNNEVY